MVTIDSQVGARDIAKISAPFLSNALIFDVELSNLIMVELFFQRSHYSVNLMKL